MRLDKAFGRVLQSADLHRKRRWKQALRGLALFCGAVISFVKTRFQLAQAFFFLLFLSIFYNLYFFYIHRVLRARARKKKQKILSRGKTVLGFESCDLLVSRMSLTTHSPFLGFPLKSYHSYPTIIPILLQQKQDKNRHILNFLQLHPICLPYLKHSTVQESISLESIFLNSRSFFTNSFRSRFYFPE